MLLRLCHTPSDSCEQELGEDARCSLLSCTITQTVDAYVVACNGCHYGHEVSHPSRLTVRSRHCRKVPLWYPSASFLTGINCRKVRHCG